MHYDQQGFTTAADGTRLFWGVRGPTGDAEDDRPTIVLNDGIGCDGFAWKYLQPEMATHHRVVHWHYRGHGRSGLPRDRERMDIAALADDLVVLLDQLGVGPAVLVGHSMGTQVSLEGYRRLGKDRTAGLVLMCGSYGRITQTFHGTDVLETVLPKVIDRMKRHPAIARALWGRVPGRLAFRMARLGGEVDRLAIREEDFLRYWEHVGLMAPDVFLPMLELAGVHSAEDLLDTIDVPTLVIAAERDTFTPPELAQHMAERIEGAHFELIKNGSHAAPVEQPTMIWRWIEEWLVSTRRGRAAAPSGAASRS